MSDSSLQLSDLLGELHRAGDVVSSGSFTVDLRHAAEKLMKFQLENPFHYGLKLVQCGVAAGASALSVVSNNERVTVRMTGVSFSPNDLASLFYYLLEAEATYENRALRALATAVNTAIGTKARQISLESWDGTQGVRHEWSLEGPRQLNFRNGVRGVDHTEFVLLRNMKDRVKGWASTANRDVFDLLFRRRQAMDREHASIYDRCMYCPIPIQLNGTALARGGFGSLRYPRYRPGGPAEAPSLSIFGNKDYNCGLLKTHHLVERWWSCDEQRPQATLRTPGEERASRTFKSGPDQPAWLALAIPATLEGQSRLEVVEDGVLLERPRIEMGQPGFMGMVCGSLFAKDLSGFKIARGQAWTDFTQGLSAKTAQLRQDLRESLDILPARIAKAASSATV